MTYTVELTPQAEKDLKAHARMGNKQLIEKIKTLFTELQVYPETGTGQPEKLKHDFSGYWSRRIDKKHRLIYSIEDETVTITVVSAWGHYADK